MRKALGAVAFVAAMWAGSAQAAYVINMTGTFDQVISSEGDVSGQPSPPLDFDITIALGSLVYHQPGEVVEKVFYGSMVSGMVGGTALTGINYVAGATETDFGILYNRFEMSGGGNSFFVVLALDADDLTQRLITQDMAFDIEGLYFGRYYSTGQINYSGSSLSLAISGVEPTQPSGVPEPTTWAMMLAGFGLAGAAIRRSRVPFHDAPRLTA